MALPYCVLAALSLQASWWPRELLAYCRCLPAQFRYFRNLMRMGEDCLYLSVYTPQVSRLDCTASSRRDRASFWR